MITCSCALSLLQLVQFLKIYVSQGSEATVLGCGEIFGDNFIANYLQSVPVKEFSKLVNIWRRYGGTSFMVYAVYSSSSSSSSDAKRSAEASRRCDCSPERSVLR